MSEVICICIGFALSTMLSDQLKKLVPLSRPIRSKTNTNHDSSSMFSHALAHLHAFTLHFVWFTRWSVSFARVIALHLVETIPTPYPPFYDPCCHLPPMKKEFHARHFVVPIILARVMSTVSYVNGMLHSNCMYNWAWWGTPT